MERLVDRDSDIEAVPADHPDRVKWNERYSAARPGFEPHPLVEQALEAGLPEGPVLELACGASGSALALAESGRDVVALDVSDVALGLLEAEARRRGLPRITLRQVDLRAMEPDALGGGFALVLCTRYWEPSVFSAASTAVAPGGILAWEAFTPEQLRRRPDFREEWCVRPGEPASLLPPGWGVLSQRDLDDGRSFVRRLLARRR
ncbi:MAG: class I SAM-dependent methyltransferase [Myxococcales bacterium]|nr:class I SAM-dependent methyltransferase [Myxococcales bacterium]